MRFDLQASIVAFCGLLVACTSTTPTAAPRDWAVYPAVRELDMVSPLYAVSDIHGGYDRLVALLLKHQLIAEAPATPGSVRWAAGQAVLVVAGDLFNKGPSGVSVIDLFRALESSAAAAGGQVLVTLGNHEAEFLVNPRNDKAEAADGIDAELPALGIDLDDLSQGREPRGQWLRQRPFAVRVGRWFFAHSGDTQGRTTAELVSVLQTAVDVANYNAPEIIGATSLLESSDWSTNDKTIGARYAQAVGAAHIVFGHNPSALGAKNTIGTAQDGALFRIDCGMSPDVNYSEGVILRVVVQSWQEIASSLGANGKSTELWRGNLP